MLTTAFNVSQISFPKGERGMYLRSRSWFVLFFFPKLILCTMSSSLSSEISSQLLDLVRLQKKQIEVLEGYLKQSNQAYQIQGLASTKPKNGLIPDDYDKRTFPPRVKPDEVNEIQITIDIFSVPYLDEKQQEIMLELKISHTWTDMRLNTTNMKKPIELEPGTIKEFWNPDSYFHHAKDSKTVELMTPMASLRIRPDKIIKYTMMMMITLGCPMSFANYPMDRQVCRLEIQSFGYNSNYNNYTWRRPPRMMYDFNLANHEIAIKEYTFTYLAEGMSYPGLGIRIELQRHLGYHLTQTYIPSVIFVTVAWFSFHVPSDVVPGRMVLCVTTLLTLISMFNSVKSLTPQVSYMKAIDLWVFVCIIFVFLALAEYGLILFLTSRSSWQKRVDGHIRTLTGSDRLRSLNPMQIFTLGKPEQTIGNGYATTTGSTIPKSKEKLAYSIEWTAKIGYPLAFITFNIVYWSYYLSQLTDQ